MAKINNIQEFGEYVQNNALIDPTELPKGSQVGWFGPNGELQFFNINLASPIDKYSIVVAIFHDDDSYMLYTFPAAIPTPRPADWKVRNPSRFTLSKISPTFMVEAFPDLDTFADALVEEWNDVAGETGGAEGELEAVLAYLENLGDMQIPANKLHEEFSAGLHHEVEDDDDETPSPTETATPSAATSSGAPVTEAPKP
jgi:hypothetical protein